MRPGKLILRVFARRSPCDDLTPYFEELFISHVFVLSLPYSGTSPCVCNRLSEWVAFDQVLFRRFSAQCLYTVSWNIGTLASVRGAACLLRVCSYKREEAVYFRGVLCLRNLCP